MERRLSPCPFSRSPHLGEPMSESVLTTLSSVWQPATPSEGPNETVEPQELDVHVPDAFEVSPWKFEDETLRDEDDDLPDIGREAYPPPGHAEIGFLPYLEEVRPRFRFQSAVVHAKIRDFHAPIRVELSVETFKKLPKRAFHESDRAVGWRM